MSSGADAGVAAALGTTRRRRPGAPRTTRPAIASASPTAIRPNHSQAPPSMPVAWSMRGSSPRASAAARPSGSDGWTSTTGETWVGEEKAQADGSRVNGRQPSGRNGSYTPLMA